MHEKLDDRTINAVYFRLCEPFQVGAPVGSLYYVLVRENFSSQCPLLHPQIYLNCHLEKIQSYLNIHVSS